MLLLEHMDRTEKGLSRPFASGRLLYRGSGGCSGLCKTLLDMWMMAGMRRITLHTESSLRAGTRSFRNCFKRVWTRRLPRLPGSRYQSIPSRMNRRSLRELSLRNASQAQSWTKRGCAAFRDSCCEEALAIVIFPMCWRNCRSGWNLIHRSANNCGILPTKI